MTDPLSVTASVTALAGFAFATSKSLYQAIESFRSSKKTVRELQYEVESLTAVLDTLAQMAGQYEDQLKDLQLPLRRCGEECKELEETINKCSAHTSGQRTSIRDWANLQFKGKSIAEFKDTLSGYKSTISIAIGSATFCQAAVTTAALEDYKKMISEATSDLQDQIQLIDEKMESIQAAGGSLQAMREARDSFSQCLKICADASDLTSNIRTNVFEDVSSGDNSHQMIVSNVGDLISAKRITTGTNSVQCLGQISDDTLQLSQYLSHYRGPVKPIGPVSDQESWKEALSGAG